MRIEHETNKPGRVMVLDVLGLSDSRRAGAAVEAIVRAATGARVTSIEISVEGARVRTLDERDDLHALGVWLEKLANEAANRADAWAIQAGLVRPLGGC